MSINVINILHVDSGILQGQLHGPRAAGPIFGGGGDGVGDERAVSYAGVDGGGKASAVAA